MHRGIRPLQTFLLSAVLCGLALPCAAQVTAKQTPASYFFYRENIGPYSRVDRVLPEVRKYFSEKGIDSPIMGIYYDNPARVSPSLQRADLGVRIDKEKALELLKEARPDATEEALLEELESERGAQVQDPYFVRFQEAELVAARRVSVPFSEMYKEYTAIQTWIWKNGYYLIGPVREIYLSPVANRRSVRAEIQIVIKKTGVPDRR